VSGSRHSEEELKLDIMAGDGEMASLMRAHDWSTTPLGPVSQWPQSLRTVVRILLSSRFAMWMGWGPELTFLYNDSYAQMTLGKKHPWALGRPSREVWAEIWPDIGPRLKKVLETGQATWDEALLLFLERNGYPEETYHTFSYSPLTDEEDKISGNLCVVTEETERVVGERRLACLRSLAADLASAITEGDVLAATQRSLEENQRDLPFTLIYLFEPGGARARRACATAIGHEHAAAPELIEAGSSGEAWPFSELLARKGPLVVEGLQQRFGEMPAGAWNRPPERALLVPIARQGQDTAAGVFIAALNPFRPLDHAYEGFVNLIAGQIAAAFANARAYQEERKRAQALAELDKAKTIFFSNVSHEFRTPLTLMLGPIESALARSQVSEEERKETQLLHRNAMRLLKLVNTLLDFSRIEAGRIKASYEPVDLATLTSDLASVFRSAAERAGLQLRVDCGPLPSPVYVDPEMWEKIVLNLISNAFKSTFEGEIGVSLRESHGLAELTVSDTGTGIPENEIPALFERFRRIEGAKRRTNEGSGIGLALVSELVLMHGGSIAVESKLGTGSTFRVRLPFGKAHLPDEQVNDRVGGTLAAGSSAAVYVQEALSWLPRPQEDFEPAFQMQAERNRDLSAAENRQTGGTVLLVDDNQDMREYVRSILSQRFQVRTAENGRIALEKAMAAPPDLVLTDVMMPEMDGFQLLSALRENPATCSVPVILLSARAGEESRVEGLQAGADDYLVKPFTARELLARVESHIRMTEFRRQALQHEAELQKAVQAARTQAAEAVEHISDGFWTYDAEWRITYMNPAAEVLSRRPRSEQIGRTIWELFPLLKGTELERQFQRTMKGRETVEFESLYEPWQRWFHHRLYPTPDGGVVEYVRDSTETHLTEQALRRAEQLAAAGKLAASISHEINNPLEAVTNLLFLAKEAPELDQTTRHMLQVADKELQRLSHIARTSLKFYRQSSSASHVSITHLVESVLMVFQARLTSSGIKVKKKYREAPELRCFPGELQQVVTNLMSNALDALPKEGTLAVSVRPSRSGNRAGIRITVADSGAGMDSATRSRLFEPFFTTKAESGTGLGLWVTKGIVEKHNGTIQCLSSPGRGSAFTVFIPYDGTTAQRPVAAESYARA
jgi:signal transduction histidine kinase/ActR/RegA family two-component response regulator